MLQELKSMFEKQAGVERFDLIQTFHACKQEEGKPVAAYVLKMKGYVEQLERLDEEEAVLGSASSFGDFRIEKEVMKQGAFTLYVGAKVFVHKVSVSVLSFGDNGFVQCFTDCGISVSKMVVLYFIVVPRKPHNLDSTYLWHCRLAHINKKRIKQLQQDGLLKSTDDESFDKCESCLSGKMTKKPFPHNDYSRYGYVYLLKHKHEVFETFKVFKNEVENQLGKTIKAIRSDRGGEYISQEFKDYLKANGIVQQLTPPYTPQHNGVSGRRENRTLLDSGAIYDDRTTLHLILLGLCSRVWGCEALVREIADKLEQRIVKVYLHRIPKETIGSRNQWEVGLDLVEILRRKRLQQPSEITSNIPQEVEGFEPPQEEVIPIRRSERTHRAPNHLCLNVEVEEHSLGDLNEPASYKAAMLDSESNKWIDAMNAEIQSMMDNMVWVLVGPPPG
ncbi:retrotransposon protein, putative, ty1-copia subclass [Tanacetum coccineum]